MPPLMLRSNPIWIAIVSFGTITSVAHADDASCPSQATPPLLSPRTAPASTTAPTGIGKIGATGGPTDVTADHAIWDIDGKGTLTGNVDIRQGDREIKANQVQYDRNDGGIKGEGGVDYTDSIVHVTGDGGDYSPTQGADFKSAQFELRQRSARGSARTMSLTPEGIISLQSVLFTTCPANDKSWTLRADSITLDTKTKIGEAHDARIDFKGVPILYFPRMSFPIGNERKSGFLFPTIGSRSSSGVLLGVPYYWNIAPNMDFTAQPIEYSRRGIDLGGDFRYLQPSQRGQLTWDFLPHDNVTGTSRSDIRLRNTADLSHNLRFVIDAENVSDPNYFEDFSQGPEGTSTAFVERRATLSYRDQHWRVDGEAQQYQTIDVLNVSPLDRPYARAPSLTASGDFGWGPGNVLRYGFNSEIVNFDRNVADCRVAAMDSGLPQSRCVTGWRVDLMPALSLNVDGPGYFVRPSLAFRETQYELNDTLPGEDRSLSRKLPIASLDTGLQFERDSGENRKLTLEPRLLYLYVPYRNQNDLPVFDTALPDLNPVELFRTNRYVGADRVSDANQATLGVTSRLLDAHNGRQFLAVTLGQSYYFATPRVTLPSEVPLTGKHSNIVAQLAVSAFKNWSADLGLQWDPQTSQNQRTDLNLQYKPAPDRIVNAAYRFERSTIPASVCKSLVTNTASSPPPVPLVVAANQGICGFEQVELSGTWPIADHWNTFVREVYSLRDNEALESFAGFEYRACCWRVRFGGRRFVSTHSGSESTGVWLQLELTGLASVGSASDAFLTEAIRGYAPEQNNAQKLFKAR
jgi:LPS-assembly protein